MKAFLLDQAGGIDKLYAAEIDTPEIGANDLRVAVKAISINPADVKVKYAEEALNMIAGPERPLILGWDIAGTVVAVGSAVTVFKEGDRVFGMVNFPGQGKAYAEYVSAPADQLAAIPAGVSFEAAAATTLAALTALQVLDGKVEPGARVLVQAGSGGVGHFAIQIAKAMGAWVVATSSARNRGFILSLGADAHIDYAEEDFAEILQDIDFVFDTQGGATLDKSPAVLAPGGQIVSIAAMEVPEELAAAAAAKQATVTTALVRSNGADMGRLAGMLADGSLIPTVSKTFPFDDLRAAHTAVEEGRTVGKVVVMVG